MLNGIKFQLDIDKIYIQAKCQARYEAKYKQLINKITNVGLKLFCDPKACIQYSSNTTNVNKNIDECNPKMCKYIGSIWWFADILNNKNLEPVLIELFIRGKKSKIFFAFVTKLYFKAPKSIRLNFIYYFTNQIPNKSKLDKFQLQLIIYQIWILKTLWKFNKCTTKPYSPLLSKSTFAYNTFFLFWV